MFLLLLLLVGEIGFVVMVVGFGHDIGAIIEHVVQVEPECLALMLD